MYITQVGGLQNLFYPIETILNYNTITDCMFVYARVSFVIQFNFIYFMLSPII